MLNLSNQRVLIVGAGSVAQHKVEQLLDCGAIITVVAPVVCDKIKTLAEQNRITLIEREFKNGDEAGAKIAIVAVDSSEQSAKIAEVCKRSSVMTNVVDRPAMCDFIFTSFLKQGPLSISVSTSGASPAWARDIRKELEQKFDEKYGRLLEAVGNIRRRIINEVTDNAKKSEMIKTLGGKNLLARADELTTEELEIELATKLGLEL